MDSFRQHLDDAKGYSEFVIALNLDIRGFSDWSLKVDSAQTALFMKKVYAKLIDRFFMDAAFVKPTGDGLLVIIDFEEGQLAEVIVKTVKDAMTIVKGFDTLCADDAIVNFEVPSDIGIGISRGAASRLASGETTLDYSGRVLNLASRLMDLARPQGVVFDAPLGAELLSPALKSKFRKRSVYLKGIAPRNPVEVFCRPESVKIPRVNRFPIGEPRWEHQEYEATWRDLKQDMGEDDEFVMVLRSIHPIRRPWFASSPTIR